MYYVYALLSEKNNRFYIGYSANLKERIRQHNAGESIATKGGAPYTLVYYEAYRARKDAMAREKKLKHHGQGIRRLKERLAESIRIENCVRGKGEKAR